MSEMQRLLDIMAQLRNPDGGCPWDLKQDFVSIATYTIEEAYEVADAIERGAIGELKDELGDLLLQVVFHAQMANEKALFDFESVAKSINEKMVRRHPHVFGDAKIESAQQQDEAWEEMKQTERGESSDQSAMAGLTQGIPEWMKAEKLSRRAARVGFDWPDPAAVMEKVDEELDELKQAMVKPNHSNHTEEELGDLLFSVLSLARHLEVDPGRALRGANRKFEERFREMEKIAQDRTLAWKGLTLEEMDEMWNASKRQLASRAIPNNEK
ncbi:MAG: nucleoside triphosphate pyrophosphohydrolase [Lysobacterales bacterium]